MNLLARRVKLIVDEEHYSSGNCTDYEKLDEKW
jgi:hypothetical protein